ncbi:MAG: sigma-70 family RNA polymerase sigma factor [Proteobacteria bacterium]|nr:sigma-70 family RNA polymerase sigma factor [Pseudomonadota bacterium]
MAAGREAIDRAALEELYARVEKPLYNVVYRWLWDAEEAHDIVQEAFYRLWRARARVDLATVEPLVYRIAINLASNRRRSRRLWQWVSWDRSPRRHSGAPDAGESLALEQRRAAVRRAVEALPERQKRVVMLCELAGMTYRQVADILDIPPGTVASRRHAALKKLRRSLAALTAEKRDHDRALERTGL